MLILKYANNSELSISTKMFISIAFVCINDLGNVIDVLAKYLSKELQSILEWFEDYYIGRMKHNNSSQKTSRFAL